MSRVDESREMNRPRFDPDELAALETERDFLLRSLDDLDAEREAGNVEPGDYERLRDDYTARAAAVIRAIRDGIDARPVAPPLGWRRRVLVVVALLGFAAIAAVTLAFALGERLPGQTASGNTRPGSGDGKVSTSERQAAFEADIKKRPGDPLAHLSYARFLLGAGDEVKALQEFDATAKLDPSNAEARAYGGWIVFLAGLVDESLTRLDAAIAADPSYPDAHFFRGVVLYRGKGDPAAAIPELQEYLVSDPTGPLADQVRSLLGRAIAETG